MRTKKIKGKHFVLDFYGCDYHEINSVEYLEQTMIAAANAAKMEILHTQMHEFKPQGVTGVLLLSTSHISVHTWPEYGHAAFDVFSCSDEAQTRLAVDHIVKTIEHSKKKVQLVDRGYAVLMTIDIPVYKTNTKKELKVHKKYAEIRSPFQKIQVLDLEQFGKTLVIDSITQAAESDHELYDRAILKPMQETDKEILILGGGDGFVAERAVQQFPNARVTVVELDPEVVFCAKTYFDQSTTFSHPRVNLVIGDALQYLKMSKEAGRTYDGIVMDLTDTPVGAGKASAKLERFYDKLLRLALPVLKEDGWISSQAGVAKAKRPLITMHKILRPLFEKYFAKVSDAEVAIPSFLESNVFLYGKLRQTSRQ